MSFRNIMQAAALAAFLGAPLTVSAQKVKAPAGGKKISKELIGIFFEDISYSADGGLYAELIENGSFEYNPNERDGWGPGTSWKTARPGHSLGMLQVRMDNPIHPNNPTYMRLHTERVKEYYDYAGWKGFGLENDGFDGISVKAGAKYDFSVFFRNIGAAKQVRVVLVKPGQGWGAQPSVLAETTLNVSDTSWKKYEATLTSSEDCTNASLQILVLTQGDLDIDMVSLMPQDTYKGHGLRKDLAEALAGLEPKFMRFPGGCVVHGGGDGFWDTYRWKTTVGPKEQRRGLKNTWGYHQSMGLGYYEYFQFCEDLGMEPLPILPCGVNCQGTNGGWSMRTQAQDFVPMSEMDEWVNEALDLIEWANGDVNTKWGKVRAEAGHPKPFNLKYLGLGNEEKSTKEFEERFKYIYDRVRAKYPDIVIVGTAGPGSHKGNPDFENGWRIAEETGVDILDEHYYEPRNYFLDNQANYDNYPRDRKTKVYLGEYAAKDKKLADALYEGLYLLGIERNGDVVTMTSYAPLFCKKNHESWNPDLIYFDNEKVIYTCSYYVQQMFGTTAGDYYYGDVAKFQGGDKYQGTSAVLNTEKGELYIKLINAAAEAKTATIDLSKFKGFPAVAPMTTISNASIDAENNFEAQPVSPQTKDIKISKKMTLSVAPYSANVIRLKVK